MLLVKIALFILILAIIFKKRVEIILFLVTRGKFVTDKKDIKISPKATWYDDYYTIEYIDEKTIAITEPRYWQKNINYLLLGEEYAILFDSGPGERDITKVVRSLTNLPVISMISHLHYDHLGSINNFEKVYLAKNQLEGQQKISDNEIKLSEYYYMGKYENHECFNIKYDKILELDSIIDIGNRKFKILNGCGHAPNSIVLYEEETKRLYAGDYVTPEILIHRESIIPGSNFDEMKKSTKHIVEEVAEGTITYYTHTLKLEIATMQYDDLLAINNFLKSHKSGKIIKLKKINNNFKILY